MEVLATVLAKPHLNAGDERRVAKALSHPACWPPGGIGDHRVAAPSVEGGLLLGIDSNGRGSLWALQDVPSAPDDVPIVGSAALAWQTTYAQALLRMPCLRAPLWMKDQPPNITSRHLVAMSGRREPHLDGDSFGLAMALHIWARLAGVNPDPHVAATGTIDEHGNVSHVDGIKEKVEVVCSWALGVTHLLVPLSDEADARHHANNRVTIIGVNHLDKARAWAFGPGGAVPTWAGTNQDAKDKARVLFRFALEARAASIAWGAMSEFASALHDQLDDEWKWRMRVAAAIADRHASQPRLIERSPQFEAGLGDLRKVFLGHVAQAFNDCCDPTWPQHAEEIRSAVQGTEPNDLKLQGAIARIDAAMGEYGPAQIANRRLIDHWRGTQDPRQATYPLSEFVRLAGVAGSAPEVAQAEAMWNALKAIVSIEPADASYVVLALGRAAVLVGDEARAVRYLSDSATSWGACALHVQASRLRWLLRTRLTPAQMATRIMQLDTLAAVNPDDCLFAHLLHRVDDGDATALERLGPDDRKQVDRMRGHNPTASPQGLADLFPY